MNLAPSLLDPVERVDRRVLGALQCVDATTRLPIAGPARLEVRGAEVVNGLGTQAVPLREDSVVFRQNRSGSHVLLRAPFFDAYTDSFEDPLAPPDLAGGLLRLRVAVVDAGSDYLPQELEMDFPRALDPGAAVSVFRAQTVPFFRAPGASVLGGWAVLRVRVTQVGTGAPLPGVLIRVYRSPRAAADGPIGVGLSEWRGALRGEALVPVADLPRFRPGAGANVFETEQEVHFEAVRATGFTGDAEQLPDLPLLTGAPAAGLVTVRSDAPAPPVLGVAPPAPFGIRAGREMSVQLLLP